MDPNLTLLVIALLNAFTAGMAYYTMSLTRKVEVATNSMKDALVKATSEASHAAGKVEGLAESAATAAAVAKGIEQGREK